MQIDQRGGKATVTLDSVDPAGRFLNQAETEMTLIDPQLASRKVSLVQTAPGRYTASFPTDDHARRTSVPTGSRRASGA